MMNLYSGTTCPFSQRCRIVLYEKGMDFQVIDVDLFAKPEDIAVINPYGKVPVLVDAGVGTASDATLAMETGCDAVLMNTAIAGAQDPIRMAVAMKHAVIAGREAFLAGRMPKRMYADPSSPLSGLI